MKRRGVFSETEIVNKEQNENTIFLKHYIRDISLPWIILDTSEKVSVLENRTIETLKMNTKEREKKNKPMKSIQEMWDIIRY